MFGVSFPFWQSAEILHIYRPLWVALPAGIFMVLFALSFGTMFDIQGSIEKVLKKIISYWLAGGFIVFFTLIFFLGLNLVMGLPRVMVFSLVVVISALLIAYSYHHASKVYIKTIDVYSEKVSRPYTIVQLSDIHIGSNGLHELEHIIGQISGIPYDYMVITGDLIDEDYADYTDLEPLNTIEQPIYYITGNHEYYLRHKNFKEFIQKTNIHDINNQSIHTDEIDIYGIDEKSHTDTVLDDLGVDPDRFNVMLLHEPEARSMDAAETRGIDMTLSGHTHNGQIFPFTWMVRGRYKYIQGLYTIGNMILHVSQGTSTWGPKMRLGTDNEITLITISPQK